MPHLKKHSSGHLQLHESGHLKFGGSWHNRSTTGQDVFGGYAKIRHEADFEANNGGENEDPNDFLAEVTLAAENSFSTTLGYRTAYIYGYVGYHGYQVWPLGWPGLMQVEAVCAGRWKKFSTGGITATNVKISTTGTANARIGVFASKPTAAQIKAATGTSSGVYLFSSAEVELYNSSSDIWISIWIPVPTTLTIPVADNTNANDWDPDEDPPQWYLGTQFDSILYWKVSGTPDYISQTAALADTIQVYY